jgi:urate oxidase
MPGKPKIVVADNYYGKSRVRLVRVRRRGGNHDLREWNVEILLRGNFESAFVDGDNSKILPTDTMKNAVYSLARDSAAESSEDFGKELVNFFLSRNPQVSNAEVTITEKSWESVESGGKLHGSTFIQTGNELQTTTLKRARERDFAIRSGLTNLVVMKTSHSAFEGYLQDSLTTLSPAKDRLFGTSMTVDWMYAQTALDFSFLRERIRDILISTFAEHDSKSVQHTLYAMGKAVLEQVQEINALDLKMPNKHCLLVDLTPFGQDNPNEIFVPVDEPHGSIQAQIRREI